MRASLLCLILLFGCGRSDVRLLDGRFLGSAGEEDGGTKVGKDGGPPSKDAGFSDAGIPLCAFAGEDLNLSPELFESTFRFELAEILSIDPLQLGFFDGTILTFH